MPTHATAVALVPQRTVEDEAPIIAAGYLAAYSGNTLKGYIADLKQWETWCGEHRIPIMSARRAQIETYSRMLLEIGKQPSTVYRRLVTISGFYRYAEDEGYIDRSPARKLRRPRVPQESNSLFLDRQELGRFLAWANTIGGYPHALACLLALNGLRVSEACTAQVEALGTEGGHRILAIMGKGSKPAVVPLAPRTARAVMVAIEERTHGPLLLNTFGDPMTRHNASRVVRRLCHGAAIGKIVGPHALRHSFITAALDAGVSLRDVQTSARHANTSTTVRYDRTRFNLDRHATYVVAAFLGSS